MVDPNSTPEIGDLVRDITTGQVFGVKDRRKMGNGDRFLVDENDQRHLVQNCRRISDAEVSQADIDDAVELISQAQIAFDSGDTETATAIVAAISAAFVEHAQKAPLWRSLTPELQAFLVYFRDMHYGKEAA